MATSGQQGGSTTQPQQPTQQQGQVPQQQGGKTIFKDWASI